MRASPPPWLDLTARAVPCSLASWLDLTARAVGDRTATPNIGSSQKEVRLLACIVLAAFRTVVLIVTRIVYYRLARA